MAVKLAVINNKGGSAKTTTVVNLAGAFSRRFPEKKILIVEADGQGNATRSFDLKAREYENSMYDVFMGNKTPEECTITAYANIDLIPANSDMNYLEFDAMSRYEEDTNARLFQLLKKLNARYDMSDMSYDQFEKYASNTNDLTDTYFDMLHGKFDSLEDEYDLIIFDTPPEVKAITSSILAIADEAIIPFEPDTYSIDGILNILSRITTIKEQYNKDMNVTGLLAVKVKKKTLLHTDVINSVMKFCMKNNINYFETEIPNSIRFASSTSYKGLPATIALKDNIFVQAYYDLLDELIVKKVL